MLCTTHTPISSDRETHTREERLLLYKMQHNFKLRYFQTWLLMVLGFLITNYTTNAAKILGIFPHASESHFMVMRTFMMELARREHNVTVYSSHRLDDRLDNLREIVIEPEFPFWKEVQDKAGVKSLQELGKLNDEKLTRYLAQAGSSLMDNFLENYQVKDLLNIQPDDFDYDLIVVDLFYTEALLALGYYFRTPVAAIVSKDFAEYMEIVQEMMVPAACFPYDLENYDVNLGFWQRLNNIKQCVNRRHSFREDHYGRQEKLIKKHFTQIQGPLPSVMDLQSNLALLLVNDYYPLATPRPLVPNIIHVGGLQVRAPRELPWHIRRFLDEARSGVVYINLGDEQLCGEIAQDKLEAFLHVFSKREERFLWTCHDIQKMDGLPKNVMLQHMVPQTDILAHPHVKIFIMNGDLLALQEAIVRHVPIVGVPLFKNELENVMMAEKLQIGLRIDYENLTETSLIWALESMAYKEFYVLNIRDTSKIYRDRPLGGLASALFWIDYVLKYGSQPLRTNGVGIPLGEMHFNDLIVYNFIVTIIVLSSLVGIYFLGAYVYRKRQTEKMFSKLN
ncbi:UDP-glycosyltransferase family 317 member A1 [Haematobia irritans]|uniref:UDP-glycosyltransferase family 317 member A1 n=1 Tax=Haematobia irritans TaxID=7368 RepID=UPI003F503FD1